MSSGRRIQFTHHFSFKPSARITQVFKKGEIVFATLPLAEKAIAKGKAVVVETPAPPAGIAATIAKAARKPRRKRTNGDDK